MRIRLTLDITRSKTEAPLVGDDEAPSGVTDGGAQIEPALDAAPGWNRIGFALPSPNEDDPE